MRALALGLFLAGCSPAASGAGAEEWPLFRELAHRGRIDVVVSAEALHEEAERLRAALSAGTPFTGEVRSPDEAGSGSARIVLGTLAEPDVAALASSIGIRALPEGGFRVLERDFRGSGDLFAAAFEDPDRPGLPLVLLAGNDAEALVLVVAEVPLPWEPRLRVWRAGEPELDVRLSARGEPLPDTLVDRGFERTRFLERAGEAETERLAVRPHGRFKARRLSTYLASCEKARARVEGWTGDRLEEALELWIYDHPEDLERLLGASRPAHVNPVTRRVHALLAKGVPDDAGAGVARATALELLGRPERSWLLDGVGVAAAGSWWGVGLEQWVGNLVRGGHVPALAELVADDAGASASPHVLAPARGLLFRVLVRTLGPEGLAAAWSESGPETDARLEEAFQEALRLAAETEPAPERLARILRRPFRNGVALLDARGPISAGYSSRSLAASLERAAASGADAVSFSVFASATPLEPSWLRLEERSFHGSASDLALTAAFSEAHRRDMQTMLCIEPVNSRFGTRADGLVFIDPEVVAGFFDDFAAVATHYGLLAELCGVEVLCLGSDLHAAARTVDPVGRMDAELLQIRLAGWERLIERARRAFGGALTYGALSRGEAEVVGFWRRLDFIGLHVFPVLQQIELPPIDRQIRRSIRRELERAAELSKLWERPVLITQIGFPSRAESWRDPTVPRGAVDVAEQRRFYDGLASVLRHFRYDESPIRGMFLWSWSTDPEAGGDHDGGYTPQGKPAEDSLPGLFGKR